MKSRPVATTATIVLLLTITTPVIGAKLKLAGLSKQHHTFLCQVGSYEIFCVRDGTTDLIYRQDDGADQISRLGYPSLSRDGRYCAFVKKLGVHDNVVEQAIWLFDIQTKNSTELIQGRLGVWSLSWSPNGKEIAFVRDSENGNRGLYAINIATREIRELVPPETGPDHLKLPPRHYQSLVSWSPDGGEIALETKEGVVLVDLATRKMSKLVDGGQSPAWSPDGKLIAYLMDAQHCFTITPSGIENTLVFSYKKKDSIDYSLLGPIVWAPDMRSLICNREAGMIGDQRQAYLVNLADKSKKKIFFEPYKVKRRPLKQLGLCEWVLDRLLENTDFSFEVVGWTAS